MSVGKKVISFSLSEKSIDDAIKELREYRKDIHRKTELLRKKLAQRISEEAQKGFSGAVVDDLIKGDRKKANVKVSVTDRDSISVVIASGEDAVWIEFGAGVYHNGPVGASPHPKGQALGMTIGGYGKGNGKKSVWGYYENGELKLTHGTPAAMPMSKAVTTVCNELQQIVKEVFT